MNQRDQTKKMVKTITLRVSGSNLTVMVRSTTIEDAGIREEDPGATAMLGQSSTRCSGLSSFATARRRGRLLAATRRCRVGPPIVIDEVL
jgi:hypothetical protein